MRVVTYLYTRNNRVSMVRKFLFVVLVLVVILVGGYYAYARLVSSHIVYEVHRVETPPAIPPVARNGQKYCYYIANNAKSC